jgi:hypothetical protein
VKSALREHLNRVNLLGFGRAKTLRADVVRKTVFAVPEERAGYGYRHRLNEKAVHVLVILENRPDIGATLREGTLFRVRRRQTRDLAVHENGGGGQLGGAAEDDAEIAVVFARGPIDKRWQLTFRSPRRSARCRPSPRSGDFVATSPCPAPAGQRESRAW